MLDTVSLKQIRYLTSGVRGFDQRLSLKIQRLQTIVNLISHFVERLVFVLSLENEERTIE